MEKNYTWLQFKLVEVKVLTGSDKQFRWANFSTRKAERGKRGRVRLQKKPE